MNILEKFIAYFVNRHLLTNLVFVIVFIGGIFAWHNTSKEEMPDIEFDHAHVTASYPGATAEEVEHFVTRPLEDQVKGLDGVYRVTSTSSDGGTNINVEFEQGYPDTDEALMEVRNAVLDVKLPDDVIDDPEVHVVHPRIGLADPNPAGIKHSTASAYGGSMRALVHPRVLTLSWTCCRSSRARCGLKRGRRPHNAGVGPRGCLHALGWAWRGGRNGGTAHSL